MQKLEDGTIATPIKNEYDSTITTKRTDFTSTASDSSHHPSDSGSTNIKEIFFNMNEIYRHPQILFAS
jgi:hypothetical protein